MNKLIVILLLIGATTMAQEKKERGHRGAMNDMTAEQIATLQTKKMTLELDLSQTQQNQIQALNLTKAKDRKAKMEEHKAKKKTYERQKPTSEERYAMQNKRLDKKLAHKQELKKILSTEQMEKWEKMHHGKRKHRGGKGKKGGRKK
ncbi:MAG: hypothetical protein ACR2MT_15370 [Aurantibacter sp.]